ncbi:hypothetical protein M8R20_12460 [Pseudomonas sp. R2.Fl]|nr:hypothetical protein [Pseudomonas sp. R2.Fl]
MKTASYRVIFALAKSFGGYGSHGLRSFKANTPVFLRYSLDFALHRFSRPRIPGRAVGAIYAGILWLLIFSLAERLRRYGVSHKFLRQRFSEGGDS